MLNFVKYEKDYIKQMRKTSLKTKIIIAICTALIAFSLFSIVISYIFYSDAVSSTIQDISSIKTQFFVIFTCAEILFAMIIIMLFMYLSDAFIINPLVSLSRTISSMSVDGVKVTEKSFEEVNKKLKELEIGSNDEIEDVYRSIQKMQLEVNELIVEVKGESWEAEHDSMTMLSNKNRLEKRKRDVYPYVDSIYAACINVVNMKAVNELISTEAGDSIISKVARELRRLQCDTIHCYRLENDNFLVIMLGYKEEEAIGILTKWNARVGRLNRATDSFECRLALGGSYGVNDFVVEDVITRADAEMYCQKAIIKNDMVNFG